MLSIRNLSFSFMILRLNLQTLSLGNVSMCKPLLMILLLNSKHPVTIGDIILLTLSIRNTIQSILTLAPIILSCKLATRRIRYLSKTNRTVINNRRTLRCRNWSNFLLQFRNLRIHRCKILLCSIQFLLKISLLLHAKHTGNPGSDRVSVVSL